MRFDLADVFEILDGSISGSKFTWRRVRNGMLFESRLDRFYLRNKGWWTGKITGLWHES